MFGDYGGGMIPWGPEPPGYYDGGRRSAAIPHRRGQRGKHTSRREIAKDRPNELAAKAHGVLQIAISIREQRLRLYADGVEVAQSSVSTGVPGHPTPTGLFNVIEKQRWHESNIYSGAPMPFMQRITWSGVALHLGVVPGHPASHGCIRMPDSFARALWGVTKVGARVIVARDEVAPTPFEHARLFALRHPAAPPTPSFPPVQPVDLDSAPPAAPAGGGKSSLNAPATEEASEPAPVQVATADAQSPVVMSAKPTSAKGDDQARPAERPLKPGPISIFISRKEHKLFVRKGFEPILSAPVTIDRPDEPLGTHLFTALALQQDGATFRWDVVTMPSPARAERRPHAGKHSRKHRGEPAETPALVEALPPSAADALDRIQIPEETIARISELMSAGASLVISDNGLGPETGSGTDFIVLTR
jgi:hypothetical protein